MCVRVSPSVQDSVLQVPGLSGQRPRSLAGLGRGVRYHFTCQAREVPE